MDDFMIHINNRRELDTAGQNKNGPRRIDVKVEPAIRTRQLCTRQGLALSIAGMRA